MSKSDSNSTDVIRGGFVIETKDQAPSIQTDTGENLKPASRVDITTEWQADADASPSAVERDIVAGKKLSFKWFWLFLALVVLGVIELVYFVQHVFVQQDWLSAAWLVVLLVVAILAVKEVFQQWRGAARLRRFEQLQAQAKALMGAPSIGQGEPFCQQVLATMQDVDSQSVTVWQQSIQPHHVDSEVLQLFESKVLTQVDQQAVSIMTRHASASAAMIAVSPFALLDMLVVMWRNLVMLQQISQCYGVKLSYWGRIGLVKRVFKTMLFAGATEIISDAGNYALGAGVTGKLSTRLAQGLGAGVLTARVGVKAMHACRPLPFIANKPPGLSKFSQQLLKDLQRITS